MKNKVLFFSLAILVLVVSCLILTEVARSQNNDVEMGRIARIRVYQGVFDVNQPGDLVTSEGEEPFRAYYHWKKFNIRELSLIRTPSIVYYTKGGDSNLPRYPADAWFVRRATVIPDTDAVIKDGNFYLNYKRIWSDGQTNYFMDGNYKIVVTY